VTVIEAALWEGVVDESQDPPGVYFVNASTGATQWESPLPAGWVAAVNDGKVYYLNEDSDETQWHFPIGDSEA
jgi:outer membrane protein assembly factor BamB